MFKKKVQKAQMLWRLAKKGEIDLPPEEEINNELNEMFKTVLLTEDRRDQIRSLDAKSRWKLITNHKKFLDNNKESLKMVSSKEIMNVVNKIKTQASLVDLQEIKRWLLKATEFQVKSFCIYDGVKFLFQRLSESEMISRSNKNYRKQIEILKLLELLSKLENGVQETLKCKNAIYYLLLNIHPYNVEITSITFEILDNVIWESNISIDLVLDSMTKIKNERNFQYRFYPFLQMLRKSKNVIIVDNVITFINDLISAPIDETKRLAIRSEFMSSGIVDALEFVKTMIAKNQYSIEDAFYETVQNVLKNIKYDTNNFYLNEEHSQFKNPININSGNFSVEKEFRGNASLYESLVLNTETNFQIDTVALKNMRTSKSLARSDEEAFEDSDNFDRVEESNKIFERNFYLKPNDNQLFENHINAILNQIEAFSLLTSYEKENKFMETLQNLLGQNKDVTDIKDLIDKIKENVLKRENFNTFSTILQKLILIPLTNNGDKIWAKLQRYIENLVILNEENEEVEGKEAEKANINTADELESMLAIRDKEIRKHLEEKNNLMVKLEHLLNSEKDLKNKLELKANFTKNADLEIRQMKTTILKLEQRIEEFSKKASPARDSIVLNPAPNNTPPQLAGTFVPQPEEINPPILPPPLNLLTGEKQPENQIPPPPFGLLGGTNIEGPTISPPPNLALLLGGPPGPPPLGLLLGGPPGPPPLGLLLGGPPGPPPLGLLLGGPPGPPPLGLLLGGPPGPPPLGLLLGGPPGPPPLGLLLGGPPGPPPLGLLLGGPPGPPNLGCLLGGPPGPPNLGSLLGGPPPPFGLLGKGGPPGPPPPFGLGGVAMAVVKQKCKPRVPLRGVMWIIMKMSEIKNTIFEKIDDTKVNLDIDKLEIEFRKKETNPTLNKVEVKPRIEKIVLIKPERAKLFDIMLVKLKCSIPSIANSLVVMDESIITLNNLDLLIPAIPTEEEIQECKTYKGDYELLANPEKLILEISKVKGFAARIKGLHFQKVYKELVDDLKTKSDILLKVWSSIRFDNRILLLFEYVLATGNYLNGVSNRGGAYGFKFDGLEKIVDCKSTINPKRNLLMFILESIEEQNKAPLVVGNEDLSEYDVITKVPINQLEIDLTDIKKGSKSIDQAIASKTDNPIDKIAEKLEETAATLITIIADLEKKIKQINEEFNATVKHFAEDGKEGSDKIGKKFYQMFQFCIHNKKELEKFRLQIKKELEKKIKEEQKKVALELKKTATIPKEKKAIDRLSTINRMDISIKSKNGDDILNDLAAKRETKKVKAANETEEGALFMSMFSKKLQKNLEEENKEVFDNIQKDKILGDLEKVLLQGAMNLHK